MQKENLKVEGYWAFWLSVFETDLNGIRSKGHLSRHVDIGEDNVVIEGTCIQGEEMSVLKLLNNELTIEMEKKYPVNELFFRTDSKNVYRIRKTDSGGEVTNARLGITKPIIKEQDKTANLLHLRVGWPFFYQQSNDSLYSSTTYVSEILAVSGVIKDSVMREIRAIKGDSIFKDFRDLMDSHN